MHFSFHGIAGAIARTRLPDPKNALKSASRDFRVPRRWGGGGVVTYQG